MRIAPLLLSLAAAALIVPAPSPRAQTAPASTAATAPASTTARVIVKYKASSTLARRSILAASAEDVRSELASRAQALGQRIGVPLTTGAGIQERSHVVMASGITSEQLAARIAQEADVEYAVPDQRRRRTEVPNDPLYSTAALTNGGSGGGPVVGQWYLKPPGAPAWPRTADSTAPSAINAQQAWDVTPGSASIVVAVIDTGIRFDHRDFKTVANGGNLLPGYDMINDPFTANDGNGRDSDASDPGDFVQQSDVGTNGCTQSDVGGSSWHGTETAGLVMAQTNNHQGIASVGHGNVRLLPVRVLGKCGGFDSDIQIGMLWAAGIAVTGVPANSNPARVLNLSLGGAGTCDQAYIDTVSQVNARGTVVVAAAGNSYGHAVGVPANCPGVIGVAGLRHVGTKVGFSDLGPEITIAAPGGNCINTSAGSECVYPIVTTSNAGSTTPLTDAQGGSVYTDSFSRPSLGTSFSAPLVAGTVALMLSVNPNLTPAQVSTLLKSTANAFPTTGGTISSQVTTPSPTVGAAIHLIAANAPICAAPSVTDQLECYCNTANCGAGMLNAYSAVLVASGAPPVPFVPPTRQIVTYQWTLSDPSGIVSNFTGANTSSPTFTASAPGTFTATLTATDDIGTVMTSSSSVTVAASAPPPASGGGGGGGGGALGVEWLLLLLAAVLALAAVERRRA